jgi:hypothetical protein
MSDSQTTNSAWTFLHACDSHLGTPRSYRFRPAINQRWAAIKEQMAALDPEFLLHGGDLTRDGDTHEVEYQLARDDLDTLPFPTFVIPGNMDVGNKHTSVSGTIRDWNDVELNMTSERLDLFASWFGPIHWTLSLSRCSLHRFLRGSRRLGPQAGRAPVANAGEHPKSSTGKASRGRHALLAVHGTVGRAGVGHYEIRRVRQLVFFFGPRASLTTNDSAESCQRRRPVLRPRSHWTVASGD